MIAKKETLQNRNRVNLGEKLPLRTPYSVFIDTCSACNFHCEFCAPQNEKNSLDFPLGKMSLPVAKKIVDNLKKFPEKVKIIRLANIGEPLLNKELTDIISYIKANDVTEKIELITNGSLFTKEFIDKLVVSGLDMIRISIEALSSNKYKEITGVEVDFSDLVKNITYLYKNKNKIKIYIKIADISVETEEKKEVFYSTFGNICDYIFIEHILPVWPEYDAECIQKNLEDTVYGEKVRKTKVCSHMFYNMVIDRNGIVTLCASDWKKQLRIGNVNTNNLYDIWNGPVASQFWKDMLTNGKESNDVCRYCHNCEYNPTDDIDDYVNEILKRMQQ